MASERSNMSDNNYEKVDSSHDTLTTAYGFANQVKQNIESMDLEEAYAAVTVDLEVNESITDIEYGIEATDVYLEMDYTPETTSFENSETIEPVDGIPPADEDIVADALEDSLDSALMINGKVVRELLSPDYDAF